MNCIKCKKAIKPIQIDALTQEKTGGRCWACWDAARLAKHRAAMTPAQRKANSAKWKTIHATTDAESRIHCQFDGLAKPSRNRA